MQGSHKQTLTLSPQGEALNSRQFASRQGRFWSMASFVCLQTACCLRVSPVYSQIKVPRSPLSRVI
jgi:hypothetical protein